KGMAHLLEHMLFKGSKRHPDVKQEAEARGARWNGTTSFDRTNYYETLAATEDNLEWALGMEADRMVNAFISEAALKSEMTVVRNEFEMGENRPGAILYQRMQSLAFSWHSYGHPIIGSRSNIERVPIERLRDFYRTWYQPDNAVLIVAGRFDAARALELVARHFGPIPRPQRTLPAQYTEEPVQDGERAVTLRRTGDTQIVAAMYRVPAARHASYPAIDVLVRVLGSTPNGRLHRRLVQTGLASAAWGAERGLHDPGVMFFGARLGTDASLEAARAALIETLEGIAGNPVTDEEVARARTELLNDFEQAAADVTYFVQALSEFSALGDWRLFYLYRDRLRAVTTEAVQRVALAYLKRANRVLGEFIPTARPDRAEIPAASDLREAIASLQETEQVVHGELFDPSPQSIEARVVRRTLANGIALALLPKKTRGARVHMAINLYWGDRQGLTGRMPACNLAGDMLMRGSRRHTRGELSDAFERLNASVSVSADGATLEVRRERLDEALALVAEVLQAPAFPAHEFEELKRSAITAIDGERKAPGTVASIKLNRHLSPYPDGHPLEERTLDERVRTLRGITLEAVKDCYHDFVGATGATIAVVGDIDPDALARQLETLFGGWRNPRPYERIAARYFDVAPIHRSIAIAGKANATLRAGLTLPMRDDHPDFPAMVLGNYLLGGTSTARLPERIREKEGLSYSVYTWFRAGRRDKVARFNASAIFAPQNRVRVETALNEELARALKDGFSPAEVEAAKSGLLQARRIARTREGVLAGRLAAYLHLGRTFQWDVEFERRIAALTPQQVLAALRAHLDPKQLSVIVAGDFPAD
ncbi:MAG: pitrilysin family protein, partial [Burkholderiales bacterium]|nr:pitrilysin family protein [Burkholderiales bacterium]